METDLNVTQNSNTGKLRPSCCSSTFTHQTHQNILTYIYKPVVKQIPPYIKHTNDFINKINDIGNIPPNIYLVKMDIKSLYTNKAGSERIAAV